MPQDDPFANLTGDNVKKIFGDDAAEATRIPTPIGAAPSLEDGMFAGAMGRAPTDFQVRVASDADDLLESVRSGARGRIQNMSVDEINGLLGVLRDNQGWQTFTQRFPGNTENVYQSNLIMQGTLLDLAAQSAGAADRPIMSRIGDQFGREFGSRDRRAAMENFLENATDGQVASFTADIYRQAAAGPTINIWSAMPAQYRGSFQPVSPAQVPPVPPAPVDVAATPTPTPTPPPVEFNQAGFDSVSAALRAQYPEGHRERAGLDQFLTTISDEGFLESSRNVEVANAFITAFEDPRFREQVAGTMDARSAAGHDYSFYFLNQQIGQLSAQAGREPRPGESARTAEERVYASTRLDLLIDDLTGSTNDRVGSAENGIFSEIAEGDNGGLPSAELRGRAQAFLATSDAATNPLIQMMFGGDVERARTFLESNDIQHLADMMDRPTLMPYAQEYYRFMGRGGVQSSGDGDQAQNMLAFLTSGNFNPGEFEFAAMFAQTYLGDPTRGIEPLAEIGFGEEFMLRNLPQASPPPPPPEQVSPPPPPDAVAPT